jgi:hypothetical protein
MVLRLLERPRINLKTFDSLAKKASNGEDIFHWVASLSKKVKNAKYRSYFDVKPGIFGVTLNAKALLEDLFHAKPV